MLKKNREMASEMRSLGETQDDEETGLIGIWSHEKAKKEGVKQLRVSGCGVTAVMTVIVAAEGLIGKQGEKGDIGPRRWQLPTAEEVASKCILRTRANDAPLPQYLRSRSVAGCSGEEVSQGILAVAFDWLDSSFLECGQILNRVAGDCIDKASLELLQWLADRLREGCLLVATLNLQLLGNDAWHHQFIYAVDIERNLVWCTNPLTAYPMGLFLLLISTRSNLEVRRIDV